MNEKVICDMSDLTPIADALRASTGSTRTYSVQELSVATVEALSAIPTVRISEVTLLSSAWVGTKSPYSQVVNIEGVTEYSQVDLTPSIEQLVIFYEKDLGFVTENEDGIVTVYAIGQKPENDYTIQVTLTEVDV